MNKSRFLWLAVIIVVVALASARCVAGLLPKVVRGSGDVVEEQREVEDFKRVHLAGIGNLIIEIGDKEQLRIEAEDNLLEYIITEVHNHKLVIEIEDNVHIHPRKPINYYLTAKSLDAIAVSGSGTVEAPELESDEFSLDLSGSTEAHIAGLQCESVEVDISGSGDVEIDSVNAELFAIDIGGEGNVSLGNGMIEDQTVKVRGSGRYEVENLKSDSLEADINGSGKFLLGNGSIKEQTVEISGTGEYKAEKVESEKANVDVSGSASVVLWVTEHLEADISGSASIRYAGSPKIDADISGSGSVKPIEE